MAPSIPSKQMAMVIEKTGGPVEYKEIPVQQPGPDEVLVNIKYSGVCHTDLHAVNGDWPLPTKLPLVGGHEGAGVVVAKGDQVTDIEIGDHAGVKWINGSCLACDFCQQSDEPLCGKALLSGYTVDGTFQQYCIAKAAHVARLHKDIPLDAVAPVLCAGITVYKGLKESNAKPGQTVAIVGAGGGLGSLAQQYAKAMGLHVIAIDSGEEKRKMCMEQMGAQAFVDFATSKNVIKEVQQATEDGQGPHAVILVAVNEKPFQQAAEYVRPRGTVVCIGLPAGAYLKAPVFESVIKMVTIKGSYVGNRKDTAEALDFYRRGLIKCPYKTVGLSELQKVYDLMHEGNMASSTLLNLTLTLLLCLLFTLLNTHVDAQIEEPTLNLISDTLEWPTTMSALYNDLDEDNEEDTDSDFSRRSLFWSRVKYYISYGALSANRIPCPPRSGRSYYTHKCYEARGPVHPYYRGCSAITRCRR